MSSELGLTYLLRRFEEVYASTRGLPWIGSVRPEQAFARARNRIEQLEREVARRDEALKLLGLITDRLDGLKISDRRVTDMDSRIRRLMDEAAALQQKDDE